MRREICTMKVRCSLSRSRIISIMSLIDQNSPTDWICRNKYIHDTCPLDKETQAGDYIELLKNMVLTIIKITRNSVWEIHDQL